MGSGTRDRLIAFRCWSAKHGRLWSLYKSWEWKPNEIVKATCLCRSYGVNDWGRAMQNPTHTRVPDPEGGNCGLFAYDQLATLDYYIESRGLTSAPTPLYGVVLLGGHVRVAPVSDPSGHLKEPGYRLRAEFARVLAVDKDHIATSGLLHLEQVALVSRHYLEAWAADAFSGRRYRLEDFA
jgi:hypothetical protein